MIEKNKRPIEEKIVVVLQPPPKDDSKEKLVYRTRNNEIYEQVMRSKTNNSYSIDLKHKIIKIENWNNERHYTEMTTNKRINGESKNIEIKWILQSLRNHDWKMSRKKPKS